MFDLDISRILISLPAIMIGLTFHEYAHGRMADYLGDDTPYYQGRLTLNPLPHIDWLGFLMLMIVGFGWAKPVQVNPYKLRGGVKNGMMLVSLAGPAMNIFLAFLALIALRFIYPLQGSEWAQYAIMLIEPLVWINLVLAVFNLIPVPPLDGSKILAGLLPNRGASLVYALEQYGTLILLLLLVTGVISKILIPLINVLYLLLANIVFYF
ncbi:MAG: site-2 protease family protein [Syntrophomonadaceae bacterium]|nr:site-2 protease family protein [Bacillota bacterium]HQA49690.1 site-2 protease family protein [Syntrophomonadaceae bacterium]HQD89687.1 site-2 protease family protein [Syntrophomonadaceae bacterium]